ncbi:MAG: DUF2179 domain-containing protein [Symbiobacteriia bacterium]
MIYLWGYLFIFAARIIDVSLSTVRMLLLVRGKRVPAAILGFFEVSVYIIALGRVMASLSNPWNLLAYALGYATGNFVGSAIEEHMALGYLTVQVMTQDLGADLSDLLRARGFGVTAVYGEGRDGPRQILYISLKRKLLPQLMETLEVQEPNAFTTVMDTRLTQGGVFARQAK